MCEVPSVVKALEATRTDNWENVRKAIAMHVMQRKAGNRQVESGVIDAIHAVMHPDKDREEHCDADANMKALADELIRPHAKAWLLKKERCLTCGVEKVTREKNAEWSWSAPSPQVLEGDDEEVFCLTDKLQHLVSEAAAGTMGVCQSCEYGDLQTCSKLGMKMEAPEFFVLRFRHEAGYRGGKARINFAGQKVLKFPRHGLAPHVEGVYRALCRVENMSKNHYITKMNLGVMLHHRDDDWYSYDGFSRKCERVKGEDQDGLAREQSFAVFVNIASVDLKEDVLSGSKSQYRTQQRDSMMAEAHIVSGGRMRTRGMKGKARRL
jgi:hypothetical protein